MGCRPDGVQSGLSGRRAGRPAAGILRIRYSAAVREAFWAAIDQGPRPRRRPESPACRRCRRSSGSNRLATCPELLLLPSWRSTDHGGARAPLSFTERCRLEELLEGSATLVRAAELLDRHRDTIGREIVKGLTGSGYRARVGQDVADTNRKRPKERRLQSRPALLAEVVQRLEQRHSPAQIAARLRQDFPTNRRCGCHTRRSIRPSTFSRVGVGPAGQDCAAYRPCSANLAGPQHY